jgi:nucleoside-diphosphate-sugar epimerase
VRILFVGGTGFLGSATIPLLSAAGAEVAVAHRAVTEPKEIGAVEHLHGPRHDLLRPNGPVERWGPDVLIDTFGGGATAAAGHELSACARRAGTRHMIAISSMDVYQACVDAGVDDGEVTALYEHPLPIEETALLRAPHPRGAAHDNVAMEGALGGDQVTILRPGAIYGPGLGVGGQQPNREWTLVARVAAGDHRLDLPDGGDQLFHRVAVERVARAILAAVERAPAGVWACNVVDPYGWTYAGLAAEVGRILDWSWEPVRVAFDAADHPWQTAHPIIGSDRRLREVLGVCEPDPRAALAGTIRWLWERRDDLASAPV